MITAVHIGQNAKGDNCGQASIWFDDIRFSRDIINARDIRRVVAIAKDNNAPVFVHRFMAEMVKEALLSIKFGDVFYL